jgi:hypothetical protein
METKTHRERAIAVIKEIADLMNEPNEGSCCPLSPVESMWSIISSLRGPDSASHHIKDLTTARIRAAIGIKRRGYINIVNEPLIPYSDLTHEPSMSGHFGAHYDAAYHALLSLGFTNVSSPKELQS